MKYQRIYKEFFVHIVKVIDFLGVQYNFVVIRVGTSIYGTIINLKLFLKLFC